MKKLLLAAFLLVGCIGSSFAQLSTVNPYFLLSKKESIVLGKNYPLLSYLLNREKILAQLKADPQLRQISQRQRATLIQPEATAPSRSFENWQFNKEDILLIGRKLSAGMDKNAQLKNELQEQPFLRYGMDKQLSPAQKVEKEWQREADGINRAIAVYGAGQKPRYAAIDSISGQIQSDAGAFQQLMTTQLSGEIYDTTLFFALPLKAALQLLELNGRMNAADFEPMEYTVNKAAVNHIAAIDWKKYPYTHILIPGAGPENLSDSLNPDGILRCRLAALLYFKGLAPLLIPSGGRVHPYKTNYSEAEEMKKYLINELGIPEYAIIMEPHARHTTTNIRNAVRLLLKYKIPTDKMGIISTTEGQAASIRDPRFSERCKNEMGIVPYKPGKTLSKTATEYLPDLSSLLVDPTDPLDP